MDDERHETCPKCDGELETVATRRERWIGSYALQREAKAALKDAMVASEHGELVDARRLTVAQYMKEWAEGLDGRVNDGSMKPSTAPTRRRAAARLGKMPTTSVRRRISRLRRSRGLLLQT